MALIKVKRDKLSDDERKELVVAILNQDTETVGQLMDKSIEFSGVLGSIAESHDDDVFAGLAELIIELSGELVKIALERATGSD